MSTETGQQLNLTRVMKAGRERVFEAWTTPADMMNWACPEGATVLEAHSDLRVGGKYSITMQVENGTLTAFGTYREVEVPTRLVYTWDWDAPDHAMGETIVTVEFNELGEGTEVVLRHDAVPSAEARDGHEAGWGSCLNRLEGLFGDG